MKNRIIILPVLLLCICLAASACTADVSALENLCFDVRELDLAGAAEYVYDSEGYFASAKALMAELPEKKAEIARKIYSNMSFSNFEENDGVCTLTVKYVDFKKLIEAAEAKTNAGASATDALGDIVESKGFSAYMKTAEGVKVTLAKEGGNALVPIGRAGVNSEFTAMLGLETFLGWFILQM